jgi:dTDP-glucose pyrophosphorylase
MTLKNNPEPSVYNLYPTDWQRAAIGRDTTVLDAISHLDKTCLQICLVVDDQHKLLGTVTDGDIRRGLLNGVGLNQNIDEIMEKNPIVEHVGINHQKIISSMSHNHLRHLPLVSENGEIHGLYLARYGNVTESKCNSLVIMAGGLGERLLPLTKECPKPMIKVAGKPILQHLVERAVNCGFIDITISVNYLKEQIIEYFGDGSKFGAFINYLEEDQRLGTAGALSLINKIPQSPFLVSNGDLISGVDFETMIKFHTENQAQITIAVRMHEIQNPFGVLYLDGHNVVKIEEKPIYRSFVNAGIYVFNPEILSHFNDATHCDMPDLIQRAREAGNKVVAFPLHEDWNDVGNIDDLLRVQKTQGSDS